MAKSPVPLTIAVAEFPHTKAILSGRIPIEGVEPQFMNVVPQIAAYRRMVRDVEFDVCELAPTTYIIARAHGAPFVALPIFVMRAFHHGGLLVRPDAGIKSPKDLEGKKVGVRAYSVTTGVWTRGILIDEYGLDSSKVTWVVDDEEHVRELQLPPNVVHAPEGTSLVEMMAKGEISAGLLGQRRPRARRQAHRRLGREADPAGRLSRPVPRCQIARGRLVQEDRHLSDARHDRRQGQRAARTPMGRPFAARRLQHGQEANGWPSLRDGTANAATDKKYRELMPVVGDDPLPFGIEAQPRDHRGAAKATPSSSS